MTIRKLYNWEEKQSELMLAEGICVKKLHAIPDKSQLGSRGQCKKCAAKRAENSRRSDPKKQLLIYAKQRAHRYGIPLNIKLQDLELPEFCPVFPDIRLQAQVGNGRRTDCSPSLDKIIPELGYVKGNIVVMSMKANRVKMNMTLDELIQLGDWARKTKEAR